mmetsp:Transcript_126406/g.188630  ORF Transcript_126406/g.188630 Transcript_126406/m.188630 type:complete len:123 (+) Transcript_126406:22-390(+)
MTSWLARMSTNIQELRIIMCPKGEGSAGMREFLQNRYHWIKALNPKLPILVRTGETAQANMYCRYDFNQTKHADLEFVSANEIEQIIRNFVLEGENMQKSEGESTWKDPKVVYAKNRGKVGL